MDEQQKQAFAARLQRIQAQQDEPSYPPDMPETEDYGSDAPPLPPVTSQGGGGSNFGPVRLVLILLVLFALFGVSAMYIFQLADPSTQIAEAPVEAPVPVEKVPVETVQVAAPEPEHRLLAFAVPRKPDKAAGRRIVTDRGFEHGWGNVATPDGALVEVGDIASGFDPSRVDRTPAKLVAFAPNADCALRRPEAGEVVRNVRLGQANGDTEVHAFSDIATADAVLKHTKATLFEPKSYEVGATAVGRLNRVDVFVTDTSGPVYLVLQALWGNTLWNVHRGPGVRIAHIAMIGNHSGIVAPNGVPFEALRIGDFNLRFDFGANEEPQACMIAPYRLPKPGWEAQKKALKDNDLFKNQMFTFNSGHRAFAAWYTGVMGVDPEAGLTEAEGAAHVLVGPVPPGLLGYRALAGRTVHVTAAENLVIGDSAMIEAHRAMLVAAAGGNVAAIEPPVRRASQ